MGDLLLIGITITAAAVEVATDSYLIQSVDLQTHQHGSEDLLAVRPVGVGGVPSWEQQDGGPQEVAPLEGGGHRAAAAVQQ